MNEFADEKKESIELIRFFIRHYKIIGLAIVFSMIVSVIVTLFIPKEYVAYGTMFPTSANSLEITLDNPSFGYDVEADRLIQLLESNQVQDIIIKKFKLIDYYDLDTTEAGWRDELRKNYFEDITYTRTIAMSVVVSARTQDPELSAAIVNTIIDTINPIREKVIKKNFENAYLSFEKEYLAKKQFIDSLTAKISILRDEVRDPQLILLSNSQTNLNLMAEKKYVNSTALELCINEYLFEQSQLNEIAKRYYKAKLAWERPIPSVYVLDRARISNKKVYPSYTMNLLVAGFGALIMSWIILFLIDKVKVVKKQMAS
jgi:uncharacterized protein involved in exopolysaccharide biosynthesis